jgi:hypothetical protein
MWEEESCSWTIGTLAPRVLFPTDMRLARGFPAS